MNHQPYYVARNFNDSYTVNTGLGLTELKPGMRLMLKPITANTGACTLALDGLAAKDIKVVDRDGTLRNTITGDIVANNPMDLFYDGTQFILLNPSQFAYKAGTLVTAAFAGSTLYSEGARYITPFANRSQASINQDGTEAVWRAPYAGYLFGYIVTFGQNSLNAGSSFTCGIYVAGQATAHSIGFVNGELVKSDLANIATIEAGDSMYFYRTAITGGSSGTFGAAMYCINYVRR